MYPSAQTKCLQFQDKGWWLPGLNQTLATQADNNMATCDLCPKRKVYALGYKKGYKVLSDWCLNWTVLHHFMQSINPFEFEPCGHAAAGSANNSTAALKNPLSP